MHFRYFIPLLGYHTENPVSHFWPVRLNPGGGGELEYKKGRDARREF